MQQSMHKSRFNGIKKCPVLSNTIHHAWSEIIHILSFLVLCFNWQDPIQGSTPMPQWPNRLFIYLFIYFYMGYYLFFG